MKKKNKLHKLTRWWFLADENVVFGLSVLYSSKRWTERCLRKIIEGRKEKRNTNQEKRKGIKDSFEVKVLKVQFLHTKIGFIWFNKVLLFQYQLQNEWILFKNIYLNPKIYGFNNNSRSLVFSAENLFSVILWKVMIMRFFQFKKDFETSLVYLWVIKFNSYQIIKNRTKYATLSDDLIF